MTENNKKRLIEVQSTIWQVDNNLVVRTMTSISHSSSHVDVETCYAKDNDGAKKIFMETVVDDVFGLSYQLDSIINTPIRYHKIGIEAHDPLQDGHCEILAKNNNSLNADKSKLSASSKFICFIMCMLFVRVASADIVVDNTNGSVDENLIQEIDTKKLAKKNNFAF